MSWATTAETRWAVKHRYYLGGSASVSRVHEDVFANRNANHELQSLKNSSPAVLRQVDFLNSLCLHDQAHELADDALKLMMVIKTVLLDFP
jgi:hypothetical protein